MTIEEIGKILKFRREFLHLSQADLAQMSEVNNRTVHVVEAGTGNPSLETMLKLAEVLGLEIVVQVKKND